MNVETKKKDVYSKFLKDTKTSRSAGSATYEATISLFDYLDALRDYAVKSGKKSGYKDAADAIVELCETLEDGRRETQIGDIDLEVTIKSKMLTGLRLKTQVGGVGVSLRVSVKDTNSTKLSDNSELEKILKSSKKERGSFDEPFGGSIVTKDACFLF